MRLVLILIALLAGTVTGAAAESRLLRSADTHPGDYPTVQAVVFLGQRLSEATSGRLGVRVHHSRLLGEESDTVALAIDGGLDMTRVNLALLAKLSEEAAIATLPYLFRSPGHMHTVLDGAIGAEILASLEPAGLVGLAFYDSGARSFYTVDKPVRSPADLAGLKIRVQNSESAMAMVRALGATPTPLEFGQVQDALKVKVI
ncbi:MAG: TRAP transporter substrate-binding protein DctP, partial [Rhodospirillales bacterium]|nr:TRAP transporter substrate-binding protein DctP [Rhodospirillales bacterium]